MASPTNDSSSDVLCVLVTAPDQDTALALASSLVDRRLVACANIVPAVTSVYRWEGKVENASEALLILKSTGPRFLKLREAIVELHPYDLPEIMALPVDRGLPAYLQWVRDGVSET